MVLKMDIILVEEYWYLADFNIEIYDEKSFVTGSV